ncbi:MAG TPA: DUF4388 domain-containing protein [Anaeromyxobacteraceae bacterium]|nr:DUF4388 domain-containing protein [Anaeromyxobacteraceae bacterium]
MRLRLGIGSEDRIVLPQRDAEGLGLVDGDEVEVHTVKGSFTLAARPSGASQPWFAGALSALTVPEALHLIFTSLKTGVLLLSFGSEKELRADRPATPEGLRRKTVFFRDGQVVFASSTDRADRLGAVLWRHGQVPREELERCGRMVRPGRPLGQVLVDEGIFTSGQLYAAMSLQVKEIVLAGFLEPEGEFAFVEGPYDEKNAVKLPERTRDLLLEGMKRVEALESLHAEVPDRDALVRPTGRVGKGLDGKAERLLEACDGTRTVRQVIEESQLGVFAGVQALAGLVRQGLVDRMAPKAPPPGAEEEVFTVTAGAGAAPARDRPSGPFEIYRRIFQFLFGELRQEKLDARTRLNSYFDKLPETQLALFQGVRLDDEGGVDVAQVLLNVSQSGQYKGAAARARALEALEAFLAFALFEVKNCLPKARAEGVLRKVGRMQVGKE